jgi:hypothetical protein
LASTTRRRLPIAIESRRLAALLSNRWLTL